MYLMYLNPLISIDRLPPLHGQSFILLFAMDGVQGMNTIAYGIVVAKTPAFSCKLQDAASNLGN